tara:strand:+ start:803 stop:1417 length:615 start_codon:yes stop_codon:yes gene_type:complete
MEEMNVKNLEILANEIQEQISKLKKDEGDIGKLLSLSSSFQEALIIFKYQLSQNISLNENELVEEMEKNQTNLIDAIEKEEFDEIVETKAEEIQLKKKSEEEKKSINEMLSQSQTTLADKFGEQQIFDLTKEIGLNERFLLTENLFSGDTNLFSKTLNRLNNCSSKEEALSFFKNDLAKKFDWNLKSTMVKKFVKLIERRYLNQ